MFNKTCSRCLCHINYFVFFFLFLAGASSLQAAPSPANPTSEIGADSSAFQQHSKPHAVPESILPPVQLPAEEETISECKSCNAKLLSFISQKENLEALIKYATGSP